MWILSLEICYYVYIGILKLGKKFCVFVVFYFIFGERDFFRFIVIDLEGNLFILCIFFGICVEIFCLVV